MNSKKNKKRFYTISKASLIELQNQLVISRDLKYLPVLSFNKLAELTIIVHKLLNGLMKSAKDR